MSLIAWYPLNNNINNQGTGAFTLAAAPSFTTTGKLTAYCATNSSINNGAAYRTSQTLSLNNTSPISIFAWVYVNSYDTTGANLNGLVSNHDYNSNSGNGSGFGLNLRNNGSSFQVAFSAPYGTTLSGRIYSTIYGQTTFTTGSWHHVGMTYDGTQVKLYLDGNEQTIINNGTNTGLKYFTYTATPSSNNTISIFSWSNGYSGYSTNCQLNDVRVYNHALSLKEVKEISRGMILHYTFNTDDLTDSSGLGHTGAGTITYSTTTNMGRKSASFNGSSNYIYRDIVLTDSMTYACWLKFGSTGSYHIIDNRAPSGETGTQPMYGGTTYGLQCYSSAGGSYTWSAATCGFTTGVWYHVAVVIRSYNATLYINGASKGTLSGTFGSNFGVRQMRIGTRCSGANWFNGQISDVRVYATALDQLYITELYEARESIDNQGNNYCNMISEDTSLTKASFTNKGIISTPSLYETITLEDGST